MSTPDKPSVFISYSCKDAEWKDRLVLQLRVLQRQSLIEVWEDSRIEAGDEWREEIEQALNQAAVAVLMISADFLTSNFILDNEVPALLQRREREGVRIIPVIVKPCPWKRVDWLAGLQARPKGRALSGGSNHQVDTDLTAIAEEILSLLEHTHATTVAEGDTKWSSPLLPENISVSRLPQAGNKLFGRDPELKTLEEAWATPNSNVVSLIAWGRVREVGAGQSLAAGDGARPLPRRGASLRLVVLPAGHERAGRLRRPVHRRGTALVR